MKYIFGLIVALFIANQVQDASCVPYKCYECENCTLNFDDSISPKDCADGQVCFVTESIGQAVKKIERGCKVKANCESGTSTDGKSFTTCCEKDKCNGKTGYEVCVKNGANSIALINILSGLPILAYLITK